MSIIGRMARTGLRRGILEGSRGWLFVGVGATAVTALRKLLTEEETVYRTELKKGEGIELRVVDPPRP